MWARLLYGGGLALVAAQLFAQGHVCGPGCSGSADAYPDAQSYHDSAPMPPGYSESYRGQLESNWPNDARAMMGSRDESYGPQEWMDHQALEYRGRLSQDNRGQRHHGHGHYHSPGQWRDQASRSGGNFNSSQRYGLPQRDFSPPTMLSPGMRTPPPGNEDFQPIPQPSLTPQVGGYRGAYPTPSQPRRSWRQPSTTPAPPAGAWNI